MKCHSKNLRSFVVSVVPQKFVSVESVPSDYSPHLPVPSLLHLLSTSSSTQVGCSSDTEHKLKCTACLCDEWISSGEREEVEVEEKKVAVFPE